ncbi:MAG TPA: 4-hydroxythreonine-4-phosphate dehydrogenase PdxA [Blastocatellia bacterium]|nr:4-hydroxythreonine-4-phosphate dehydrogenase PdxA [Blastocatellia bacterium]
MTRTHNSHTTPRVGITTGDPAGIGPEIALKSVAEPEVREACRPVLIGDAEELRSQARKIGLPCDYRALSEGDLSRAAFDEPVICDTGSAPERARWGVVSPAGGRAAVRAIESGVRLCLRADLDAIATAPINKEALRMAGSPFPGHTEMLASLCGSGDVLMCFFAGPLKVFLLTIHMSLADAIKAITKERVAQSIRLADRELRRFGIARPRIAVAGLNPHAGEHGLFGSEEEREIEPAISECRAAGDIEVSGPFPADTLFVRAARGEFDAVAACYHDQGLIAVKCMAFGEAVNVTLGLPIIRTSVDHGTAFDIAGRGVADHNSLVEAIKLAARLATSRRETKI